MEKIKICFRQPNENKIMKLKQAGSCLPRFKSTTSGKRSFRTTKALLFLLSTILSTQTKHFSFSFYKGFFQRAFTSLPSFLPLLFSFTIQLFSLFKAPMTPVCQFISFRSALFKEHFSKKKKSAFRPSILSLNYAFSNSNNKKKARKSS